MTTQNLEADRLAAELREQEARLDMLEAQARKARATEEIREISGLSTVRERARESVANMKKSATAKGEQARLVTKQALHDLETGIKRIDDRYHKWDAARERRFNASLDKAEAKLRIWKAQAQETDATRQMQAHDALAQLEERIALARADQAELDRAKYDRKSQEALYESARHFDEAYEAAARQYSRK